MSETATLTRNTRARKTTSKTKALPAILSTDTPINLKLTSTEHQCLWSDILSLRDASGDLKQAKADLEAAEKAYKKAIDGHNHHMHEALSQSFDIVLKRLPIAERRFIIQEIVSAARHYTGQEDIIITRDALMKFVESLVFYCM